MSIPPEVDLANRTQTVINAVQSVTSTWIVHLIDPALDDQPPLRNKIFPLLYTGLVDSCLEYRNRFNGLKTSAKKLKSESCAFYLDAFERYVALAADLLSIVTREESLWLFEFRNSVLHGHWDEIHKAQKRIRYVSQGNVISEKLPATEYWEIDRNYAATFGYDSDSIIESVRARFCHYTTWFWAVDASYRNPMIKQIIEQGIRQHSIIAPQVLMIIPDPSDRPKPGEDNPAFASLLDFGRKRIISSARKDPITEGR